jgi:hypothetical protein
MIQGHPPCQFLALCLRRGEATTDLCIKNEGLFLENVFVVSYLCVVV